MKSNMTTNKLIAIIIIFFCVCIAWIILGKSNETRTEESFNTLKKEVSGLFGDKIKIDSPFISSSSEITVEYSNKNKLSSYKKNVVENNVGQLKKTKIDIDVFLDQRKKGNLWFPTFNCKFKSEYQFKLTTKKDTKYYLNMEINSGNSIYTDIQVIINDEIINFTSLIEKKKTRVFPDKNGNVNIKFSYKSTGMESLSYFISPKKGDKKKLEHFLLKINTDFNNFNFSSGSISPTKKIKNKKGYSLIWDLNNSITSRDIILIIPNKINPGVIISKTIFFAPVSLLFFFFVIVIFTIIFNINIHPFNYFFLGATFFAFHLMYAYFSDHMNIHLSFVISSLISIILTITYLRLFTPKKMAFFIAPLCQLIFLIIFSFSFFLKGTTGITVTVCSVLTLFILMQITGKINWDEVFKQDIFQKKN